jgi:enterochelin esterase-like enzyme
MQSQVVYDSFYSPALQLEKKYCIYLPPSYQSGNGRRYSTVYLLPGLMDYERTWCDQGRVHEHMDNLLHSGKIGEMIVVMPDKEYEAALQPELAEIFARYLGGDLIAHIDCAYRTIAYRNHRGIEGLSLGAGWAMRMALWFPQLYASVSCLSGSYGEDTYDQLVAKKDRLKSLGMRFRIGTGTDESECITGSREFAEFIQSLGLYCEFSLDEGPHEWTLWSKQIYNSLQFHYYTFNPA